MGSLVTQLILLTECESPSPQVLSPVHDAKKEKCDGNFWFLTTAIHLKERQMSLLNWVAFESLKRENPSSSLFSTTVLRKWAVYHD